MSAFRDPALSDDQLDRYAPHILLAEIGGAGQRKLLGADVAVIGAGGIGSPAIIWLAAAGIGRLTIVDDDRVALANLTRQTLFAPADVGRLKAEAAGERVVGLNTDVKVVARCYRLSSENAADLLGKADLILDGSDNFATRLVVSDYATRARIPLVSAAIGRFQVQIATFRGWEAEQPCYRCYVGGAFDAEDCDDCSRLGVLGPLAGLAGCWAAMEAVRAIAGFGPDAAGRLHLFDGLAPKLRTLRIAKDPDCICS